jgi:hypothetical protein
LPSASLFNFPVKTKIRKSENMKNPNSALKVDNLHHIHDHGLAVEFTAPKLVALLTYLRAKQGVTELKAGHSTLRVTTLGNVTKTEAFFSVGRNRLAAIHYFEAATGLKYTLSRESGDANEHAFHTLNAVIFGGNVGQTNDFWKVNFGAQADKLRDWLKKFAWCITGANGLRGQALAARFAQLDQTRASAFNVHASAAMRHNQYATEATPEFFRNKHADARAKLAAELANVEKNVAEWQAMQADAEKLVAENKAEETHNSFGWRINARKEWENSQWKVFFPAVGAQFSHPVTSANYAATVDASGGVSLSSGIRCEFTAPQVLQWLRGEASAPFSSRYGKLERREVATKDGAPLVLLKCGCHWIDAANVSAEFAQALTPTHTVTRSTGKPRAEFGTPEFSERLREAFAEKIAAHETQRADAIRQFADRRAYLTKEETDLPATIADLKTKADAAKASLDAAEKAIADAKTVSPLGADAETLAALARLFLSSQSFHPSL